MYFDCTVCCNTIKENNNNKIHCIQCNYIVCNKCQKIYNNEDCMNCHLIFTNKFLIASLGKNFVNKELKIKKIKELMIDEIQELQIVQPIVDYELKMREIKKNKRFGINEKEPEKPDPYNLNIRTFRCPINNCRGFVLKNKCGICKCSVCMFCREKNDNMEHKCDINIINTLKEIGKSSKECPKCYVLISKTEGCDHMVCTNCHTKFNWSNLKITNTTTNTHYATLKKFSDNIILSEEQAHCDAEYSVYHDKIAFDLIDNRNIDNKIIEILYEESKSIRYLKKMKYDYNNWDHNNKTLLQNYRIKFLLNEMTQKQWESKVYSLYKKNKSYLLIDNVIDIYLTSIDNLQSVNYNNTMSQVQIYDNLINLKNLCNESIKNITEEFEILLSLKF